MKNEYCKMQNLKFETNTQIILLSMTINPMMLVAKSNKRSDKSFVLSCIFQFAICILQLITQNPQDFE